MINDMMMPVNGDDNDDINDDHMIIMTIVSDSDGLLTMTIGRILVKIDLFDQSYISKIKLKDHFAL